MATPLWFLLEQSPKPSFYMTWPEKIAELLPALASLTAVLLADPTGMDVSNFVMTALAVKKCFPLSAERMWCADRVSTSA